MGIVSWWLVKVWTSWTLLLHKLTIYTSYGEDEDDLHWCHEWCCQSLRVCWILHLFSPSHMLYWPERVNHDPLCALVSHFWKPTGEITKIRDSASEQLHMSSTSVLWFCNLFIRALCRHLKSRYKWFKCYIRTWTHLFFLTPLKLKMWLQLL